MIELLIGLIILLVVVYIVNLIIAQLSLPEPIKTVIYIVIGLVFLLYLLDTLGIYSI